MIYDAGIMVIVQFHSPISNKQFTLTFICFADLETLIVSQNNHDTKNEDVSYTQIVSNYIACSYSLFASHISNQNYNKHTFY